MMVNLGAEIQVRPVQISFYRNNAFEPFSLETFFSSCRRLRGWKIFHVLRLNQIITFVFTEI